MMTRHEIESRIRFLLCQELDRRVAEAQDRAPTKCKHHIVQPLDTRRQVQGEPNDAFNRIADHRGLPVLQTIGLCGLGRENPEDWNGTICEDIIDAKRCPTFEPLLDKQALWAQFVSDMSDAAWTQEQHPALASLLWVLDDGEPRPTLPWWKRLWFRFLRIRPEPILPPTDYSHLLPPAP